MPITNAIYNNNVISESLLIFKINFVKIGKKKIFVEENVMSIIGKTKLFKTNQFHINNNVSGKRPIMIFLRLVFIIFHFISAYTTNFFISFGTFNGVFF